VPGKSFPLPFIISRPRLNFDTPDVRFEQGSMTLNSERINISVSGWHLGLDTWYSFAEYKNLNKNLESDSRTETKFENISNFHRMSKLLNC